MAGPDAEGTVSIVAAVTCEDLGLDLAAHGSSVQVDKVAFYDGATRRAELDLSALAARHPYLLVLRQSHLEAELGCPDAGPVEQALEALQRLEARAFEGYAFFVSAAVVRSPCGVSAR